MLTREHAIADVDFDKSRVVPDRLTTASHQQYLGYAERMLDVYRSGLGRTRRDLHRTIERIFADEEDCPARRIRAFCKLLDDVSKYERDTRGRAAALRRQVFRLAASKHPLVRHADRLFEHEEADVKAQIAAQLGRPWDEIDGELYSDVIEFHRLRQFQGYPDGRALLSRYNVAQAQVALFDAVSMTVWAEDDFKTILRYAKLARLMHTITRQQPGRYCLRFDGPASILRETRRYGVSMARFLPALVACRGWRMHSVLQTRRRGWKLSLDLSPADGLRSHLPPPELFDSHVEEAFAKKWGSEDRDGWRLVREDAILHRQQKVFIPDFVFRHDRGRSVLMEIIGFWTPEYLQAKLQTLQLFHGYPILLAVVESATKELPPLPRNAITYKTALRLEEVLDRLSRFV